MILEEIRRKVRGITTEELVHLLTIGGASYYLSWEGVLAIGSSEEGGLPLVRFSSSVTPFNGLPDFSAECRR